MGWIKDWVNSMFRWFRVKVLEPIIRGIINIIDTIKAEMAIFRHQLVKDLAKWLDNDFRFVLTVLAAVALGVVWPTIWTKLLAFKEKLLASAMVEAIRAGVLKITASMFWINVETLHLILKVVWPDYVKMMGDFSQAVAGLAAELGEGSGYILAYFQLQHAIAYNTGALLGIPPEATELESYSKIAEFTKRIDQRFRRYAYDPGLIYSDFLEEIVIPSAEELSDTQQALVAEVRENHERNVEMDLAITGMESAVDDFIEAMPDEIAEQIEKRWAPIKTWMEENYHYLVDEVLSITGELTRVMELRQSRIEQANAYAQAKLDDPLNSMLNYELANEEQRKTLREHNLEMIAAGLLEEAKETSLISKPAYDKTFTIIADLFRNLPGPKVLKFEQPGFASIPKGVTSKEDWFIGEY